MSDNLHGSAAEKPASVSRRFFYPMASADRGLRRLLRRLKQFLAVFTTPDLSSEAAIIRAMQNRYASEEELSFYRVYGNAGFEEVEEMVLRGITPLLRQGMRVLVVGCGGGREVFAFEERGFRAAGVDSCGPMLDVAIELAAERGSEAEFVFGTPEDLSLHDFRGAQPFDLIFVAYSISNHIPGRRNRVAFWQSVRRLLAPGGLLMTAPMIRPPNWRHPHFWGSLLLRMRWLGTGRWEPGDTVRSFFGHHARSERPLYFHHHPHSKAVRDELADAGFDVVHEFDRCYWVFRNPAVEASAPKVLPRTRTSSSATTEAPC